MQNLILSRLATLLLLLVAHALPARADEAAHRACEEAVLTAEQRHGIPPGLLAAIARVESGRSDATGVRRAWPWSVNAQGLGRAFTSRDDALGWVSGLRADGVSSIDVGCLQVNLRHHPFAFATLAEAFDPVVNADYAARFLASLRAGGAATLDEAWLRAAGSYHSATGSRALAYRRLVEQAYAGTQSAAPHRAQVVRNLAGAGPDRGVARRRLEAALLVAGVGRIGPGGDRLAALLGLAGEGGPRLVRRVAFGHIPTH